MSGTIGGHAPIITNMTLGVPKHEVAAILIGGGPYALLIRPTGFVADRIIIPDKIPMLYNYLLSM